MPGIGENGQDPGIRDAATAISSSHT